MTSRNGKNCAGRTLVEGPLPSIRLRCVCRPFSPGWRSCRASRSRCRGSRRYWQGERAFPSCRMRVPVRKIPISTHGNAEGRLGATKACVSQRRWVSHTPLLPVAMPSRRLIKMSLLEGCSRSLSMNVSSRTYMLLKGLQRLDPTYQFMSADLRRRIVLMGFPLSCRFWAWISENLNNSTHFGEIANRSSQLSHGVYTTIHSCC